MGAVFEMEMERLDGEIEKTRKKFYSALLGKKRRVKRTWLEISALTNAHLLQMLPYRAMLSHVAKLAEERDKIIEEIVASRSSSNLAETVASITDENGKGSKEEEKRISSIESNPVQPMISSRKSSFAKDEAVQTDESSFSSGPE